MSGKTRSIFMLTIAVLMLAVSAYLTLHFFEVKFPEGLSGGSMCNINEFFNCDKTTNSALGAPFDIPTSVFGGVIGLFLLVGALVKREAFRSTLFLVVLANFAGCVILMGYSLLVLHSICLFCTGYYILSAAAVFVLWPNKSVTLKPNLYVLAVFAFVAALILFEARQIVVDKKTAVLQEDANLKAAVISEFKSLPKVQFDNSASEFKLNRVAGAPVSMVIFSDFECPACRALSAQIPEIIQNYKSKVDISYYFYPLDQACNDNVHRVMHLHACRAAAAAVCLPKEGFYELHELFFSNQDSFEQGFVEQLIVDKKIESCVADPRSQKQIKDIIKQAEPVDVQSTPTFLLNGTKFEGAIPMYKLKIILDELTK